MDAVRELCWIPVFGGGFGMSPDDALDIPLGELDEWLEWMIDRRRAEAKALGGR